MSAGRIADFCYRLIVWLRLVQGLGAALVILGLLASMPQVAVAGAVFLAVPQLPKKAAERGLGRYAALEYQAGGVKKQSGLDLSRARNEDYARIWLRNR